MLGVESSKHNLTMYRFFWKTAENYALPIQNASIMCI